MKTIRKRTPIFQQVFLAFFISFVSNDSIAQKKIISLHAKAPAGEKWNWDEQETNNTPLQTRIAYNITKPTLTVFKPDSANGTAVIICPGGSFHVLNIVNEGEQIAMELNKKGITAFILRYRVVHSLTDDPWKDMMSKMQDSARFQQTISVAEKLATEDLKTAINYLRSFAADLKIDPKKVGVIGFSGGGVLAVNLSLTEKEELRPDFAGFIYTVFKPEYNTIPPTAPPAFIACATDDTKASALNSINFYTAWKTANIPAELHIYSKGEHGLMSTEAAKNWISRFEEWLTTIGF